MRFLFLTQYFPPEIGAPSARLGALAKELRKKGHGVEVITALPNYPTGRIFPSYQGRLYVKEEWEGIPIHRVWLYPALGSGLRRLLNYGSFTFFAALAFWKVKKPDIILVESPPLFLGVTGWLGSQIWRVPLVLNVADLWPDAVRAFGLLKDGIFLRLAYKLEGWTYKRSHLINAVTQGISDVLTQDKGVPGEKVLFFPNGVDTDLFRPLPSDLGLQKELGLYGKQVILYAGNHGIAHGLDVVIEAACLIQEEIPEAHFLLVGDGSEKKRLEALVAERRCRNVTFLPPCPPEELVYLYSFSAAALVTLKNDPLNAGARPSKIFPAMASGKPIVYCGSGEGAKLVTEAGAGIVVPPGNPEALKEALVTLLRNPNLAEEMGQRGRRYVVDNYSWSKIVGEWLTELERRLPA